MKYLEISRVDYDRLYSKNGLYKVLRTSGVTEFYKNGSLHRNEEPAVIRFDLSKEYYQEGELHRTGGAAIEWVDGPKWYYERGVRHRLEGPAISMKEGDVVSYFYYITGVKYSKEEFVKQLSNEQLKRFLLNPENF